MPDTFYLPSAGTAPLPSLAFGTGWNKTSQAIRRPLMTTPSDTAEVAKSVLSSATAPEFHCAVQYQIRGLAAQTFGGTLSGQLRAEVNNPAFAGTLAITARVVSSDGATIRGQLIGPTPAASVAVVNPPQLITSIQNRKFRDSADVSQIAVAAITALDNDVLVIEIGARDNDTGSSRSAFLYLQDLIASGNLPEDETTTTALNPWIRFSQSVTLRVPAVLATTTEFQTSTSADLTVAPKTTTARFYLPSSGPGPLPSQAYGSGWNKTSQATRLALRTAPTNTADATRLMTSTVTAPEFHLGVQFQFQGLTAQTISGTLKGQIRADVNNALFAGTVAIAARVVSADGSTVRGELIGTTPAASATATTPPLLTTSTINRMFRNSSDVTAIPLSSVVAQAGDVLIIELGVRDNDTGTSRSGFIHLQDLTSGGDLPEDATTTTALNPWIEFSTPIAYSVAGQLSAATTLAISTAANLSTSAAAASLASAATFRLAAAADLLANVSQPISATFALGLSSSAPLATTSALASNQVYGYALSGEPS